MCEMHEIFDVTVYVHCPLTSATVHIHFPSSAWGFLSPQINLEVSPYMTHTQFHPQISKFSSQSLCYLTIHNTRTRKASVNKARIKRAPLSQQETHLNIRCKLRREAQIGALVTLTYGFLTPSLGTRVDLLQSAPTASDVSLPRGRVICV
jgi:hypothetical protein